MNRLTFSTREKHEVRYLAIDPQQDVSSYVAFTESFQLLLAFNWPGVSECIPDIPNYHGK